MRRRFIVPVNTIEDMLQAAPLLARCVPAALMISHGLRSGVDLVFYSLNDGFAVHFVSDKLKGVRPDEASVLGILTKAFRTARDASDHPRSIHSGVLVCKRPLNTYLTQFSEKYLCCSRGLDLKYASPSCQDVVFIVPLHHEIRVEGVVHLKCFTNVLWPDQVISLLNLTLDRCCR